MRLHKKIFPNKKAFEGPSFLTRMLLSIFVLFLLTYIIILAFSKYNQTINSPCPEKEFCKRECDYTEEYIDNSKTCEDKNKCCMPVDPTKKPLSKECNGKAIGDYCGNKWPSGKNEPKVCNEYLKCVELCDFCASNPSNEKCKINQNSIIGKKISSFNSEFKCGCAISECKSDSKHTCIKNFCSATDKNSNEYYCCNKK